MSGKQYSALEEENKMAFILTKKNGQNSIVSKSIFETLADKIFNKTPSGEHRTTKMYVKSQGEKLQVEYDGDPEE
jgi:hypothetical protein